MSQALSSAKSSGLFYFMNKTQRLRMLARSMREPLLEEEEVALSIDDDVPIPGTRAAPYRWLSRAFTRMQPGQSVVFNGHHGYIHWLASVAGIRVRTRMVNGEKIPLRGTALLRIWRVQ